MLFLRGSYNIAQHFYADTLASKTLCLNNCICKSFLQVKCCLDILLMVFPEV